tara:strand:+ start:329 stop:499 length:171 start_codon:yes stop_codon:yes gene_type:complete
MPSEIIINEEDNTYTEIIYCVKAERTFELGTGNLLHKRFYLGGTDKEYDFTNKEGS